MIQKMSDILKDPKKVRNIKLLGIIMGLLILFVGFYSFTNKSCFIERAIFVSEELQESKLCTYEKCLFITIQPYDDKYNYTRTLYFADDTDLLSKKRGFRTGEDISMQWCKADRVGDYKIRGIEQK